MRPPYVVPARQGTLTPGALRMSSVTDAMCLSVVTHHLLSN